MLRQLSSAYFRPAFALSATAGVSLLLSSGCVQRRMTVRTNVPGAQVYVDDHEVGRTPVSTDFIYYGDRTIKLVKDGYETQTIKQPVDAPWYQWPGIDFFSENVWPWEIRDERQFNYQMQPQYVVPTDTLLTRAEDLRRSNTVALQTTTPALGSQPISAPGIIAPPGYLSTPAAQPTTNPYTVTPPPTLQPSLPGYPSQPSPYAPPAATGS
ncbi:MAG: PEGA domain-containing protein [Planctomycetales bacterium]|nr:PEGA domain-containing protein [Planctomycetales bacterium]